MNQHGGFDLSRREVRRPLAWVLACALATVLLLGCAGPRVMQGPPETWDGPRNGAMGAAGWASAQDGRAEVTVDTESPWVAASWVSCTLSFRPEGVPIQPGGGVRVGLRRGSDASLLQSSDPGGEGCVSAVAKGPDGGSVRADLSFFEDETRAAPWVRGVQVVLPHGLPLGGTVSIVIGDLSRGGPGFRVQTFTETTPVFRAFTDADGDRVFGPTADPVLIPVVAGEAVRWYLSAPATVEVGELFDVAIRAEDLYWNTVRDYSGPLDVTLTKLAGPEFWEEMPADGLHGMGSDPGEIVTRWNVEAYEWTRGRAVVHDALVNEPGLYRLQAEGHLESLALPLLVTSRDPQVRLYWGDLHGHTELCDGAGTIDGFYQFARDEAGLDFATATCHDWLLSDAEWEAAVKAAERAYEPGRFVTYPAYEWSERGKLGGDHNVFYVSGEPVLFRCSRSAGPNAVSGDELLEALQGRDVLLIPHVGGRRGRWEIDAPDLKRVCEIMSVHGRNESYGLEGLCLRRRVGFIGSGDTHTGHPGRAHPAPPTFAAEPAGLAAVWARDLTRDGIADAIRSRRTYATTGERILIDFEVEGRPMGSEVEADGEIEITARVAGTAPIELIEIQRLWRTVLRVEPGTMACTLRWTDEDPKYREVFYYLHVRQTDGNEAWSSPIWIPGEWTRPPDFRIHRATRTRE